ncbi:glycerophosphodiester phosphodiesterase [Opitutus sp. ER46]|uniref:glycerophosphodiester phosphodiesterase n=1 Tax=Opitutus sp. ER46 TaxID=2161864 RepID=UPI000D2FB3AD|nr:glycerophosphodiester phosphodiesterase [Opitutus sp. ER46]PTX97678.1 glycerophosphodiester phosphodiesterase [Opitutus sp. ER46]
MIKRILPLVLAGLALTSTGRAVDIVAHRGASYDAPENTLASNRLAWEQGTDVVETDIYLTKDGQLVVLHDKNTKRTTGQELVPAQSTLDELRALDAGSWKGPQFKGEKLPTFEEQIALIPAGKRMFVEIKVGPEIVPAIARCLKKTGATPKMITFISFNYDALKAVREELPEYKTQYLAGYKAPDSAPAKKSKKPAKPQPTIDEVIAQAKAAGFTGLDLQSTWPLTPADVKKIKDAGLELHVWTVDDPEVAKHWVQLGTESITTNRPGWLRAQLKG